MKLTGLFIAVYILILATIPCCAIDNCPGEKAGQSAHHEKGDEDCGNCSPFFNCEGCAAVSIAYEPFCFEFPSAKQSHVYGQYPVSAPRQLKFDFWQPPKTG